MFGFDVVEMSAAQAFSCTFMMCEIRNLDSICLVYYVIL